MNGGMPSTITPLAPRVRIVTINWNAYDDLARLLQRLRHLTYPAFDVVVVDNASTDGSRERLSVEFPEVSLLPMTDNLGFGGANNVALRQAIQDNIPWVWVLNHDALPAPDALTALVAAGQTAPQIGAVGGVVFDDSPPGHIQAWGGGHIYPWLGAVRLGTAANDPLDFITGACLLLRTDALHNVGLFDERFFLYWEDADLCVRLRQAGWHLAVADSAHIWHRGSAVTGRNPRRRSFHSARSLVLFLSNHERFPHLKSLTAIAFQSLLKCLRGNFPAAAGFWSGWRAGRAALQQTE
jgi:GT2 family glycosyltransferase